MPRIARVAVSHGAISIDRPFDYFLPETMADAKPGMRVLVPFGTGGRLSKGFILMLRENDDHQATKPISYLYSSGPSLDGEGLKLASHIRESCFCTFFEAADALLPPGIWDRDTTLYSLAIPPEEVLKHCGRSEIKTALAGILQEGPKSLAALRKELGKDPSRQLKELMAEGCIETKTTRSHGVGEQMINIAELLISPDDARAAALKGAGGEARLRMVECLFEKGPMPEKELLYLTGCSQSMLKTLCRRGVVIIRREPAYKREMKPEPGPAPEINLNESQRVAFSGLSAMLGKYGEALLYGVTGSGKTLVYISLIKEALKTGGVIMLVPEIALTPQVIQRFYRYFGDQVAVIHSGLSEQRRFSEYGRIARGEARIVVGTRSAVLSPVKDLKLIIIDEEQEYTYKSENPPRYDAREVARYRCRNADALLVSGSATPSVASMYRAETGDISLFTLPERYGSTPLPHTEIIDMRGLLLQGIEDVLSPVLQEEIAQNLREGEQTILFLNRRGSARMAVCPGCGYTPGCPNCSVSLIYHSKNGRLMCHHCGYSEPMNDRCPECGTTPMRLVGSGTQRVEEELRRIFPDIKTVRMDADTTTGRTSHEALLDEFSLKGADVLLGTQMISKGLDFENVTLVGVLDADASLTFGDHLSRERTFSLLTQVVGRAGRRKKTGRAVIQTNTPNSPVIRAAAAQDYDSFYRYEIPARELLQVPPFADIFTFTLSGENESDVVHCAIRIKATLEQAFSGKYADIKAPVLGPAPDTIAKVNGMYRYRISFRGKKGPRTRELIHKTLRAFYTGRTSGVSLWADTD